jgi:hypothetical protein
MFFLFLYFTNPILNIKSQNPPDPTDLVPSPRFNSMLFGASTLPHLSRSLG